MNTMNNVDVTFGTNNEEELNMNNYKSEIVTAQVQAQFGLFDEIEEGLLEKVDEVILYHKQEDSSIPETIDYLTTRIQAITRMITEAATEGNYRAVNITSNIMKRYTEDLNVMIRFANKPA